MWWWLLSLALAGPPVPGTNVSLNPPAGFRWVPDAQGFRHAKLGASLAVVDLTATEGADLTQLFADPAAAANHFGSMGLTVRGQVTLRAASGQTMAGVFGDQVIDGRAVDSYVALVHGPPYALLILQVPTGALTRNDVEASLATVSVAPSPPLREQLQTLPFRFDNPGALRVVDTDQVLQVRLTVGALDPATTPAQPSFTIVSLPVPAPTTREAAEERLRAVPGFEAVAVDHAAAWPSGPRASGQTSPHPNDPTTAASRGTRLSGQANGRRVIFHLVEQEGHTILVLSSLPADQADALTPVADALAASVVIR